MKIEAGSQWDRPVVEVASNPIERRDRSLAREFEAVVLAELEPLASQRLTVHFGVWEGEEDGPRYVCRIEAAAMVELLGAPAWRWWSPLVRTPTELAALVQATVLARRPAAHPAVAARGDYWGWDAVSQAGA